MVEFVALHTIVVVSCVLERLATRFNCVLASFGGPTHEWILVDGRIESKSYGYLT